MIVYTCITGNHMPIPKQEHIHPNVRYYLFHDYDIEEKHKYKPWKYIKIKTIKTHFYTQRKYKLLSHFIFKEDCLYIDPKCVLTKNCFNYLTDDYMVGHHPNYDNYFDELIDWFLMPCITYEEAISITKYLKNLNYDFKKHFSMLATFIYRKYNKQTIKLNNKWWSLWKTQKKRDQLFFPPSVYLTKSKVNYKTNCSTLFSIPIMNYLTFANPSLHVENLNKLVLLTKEINKITGQKYTINPNTTGFRRIKFA